MRNLGDVESRRHRPVKNLALTKRPVDKQVMNVVRKFPSIGEFWTLRAAFGVKGRKQLQNLLLTTKIRWQTS